MMIVTLMVMVMVVSPGQAAPGPKSPGLRIDFTQQMNDALDQFFAGMPDQTNEKDLHLNISIPAMAELVLDLDGAQVTGIPTFRAYDCTAERTDGNGQVHLTFRAPVVILESAHYVMSGTFVDHIHLNGEGPMLITVDEMEIGLSGTGQVNLAPFSIEFTEVTLDLEMYRWTVEFEGMMPGTDLGTVFNEFFTMCGPELFDLWEIKINDSGKLLDWANCIFSGSGGDCMTP